MRQRLNLLLCLLVVGLMLVPAVLAQEDLTETFTSEDNSYTFMYPSSWVEEQSGDLQTVSNGETGPGNVTIAFLGPADLPEGDTPVEILEAVKADLEIEGKVAPTTLDEREAATLSFDGGADSGLLVVIQFDSGDYGLMAALGDIEALNAHIDSIVRIAETFNSVGGYGVGEDRPVFPQSYVFGDQTTVYYPSSWDYREDDNGYIHVFDDDTDLIFTFYGPGAWDDMGAPVGDLAALMAYSYNPIDESIAFEPDNIVLTTFYGRDVAIYQYEENLNGTRYQRILFTLNYDICDSAIQASAVPRFDYDFVDLEAVFDIVSSFDFSNVTDCFDPRESDNGSVSVASLDG